MSSPFLCCWKRVFAMTSVFSWQNSISLCPASFCTPRPYLPVTPGVSRLPTFAFQSPIMKGHLFWVLVEPRTTWMLSMGSTSELYPRHDKPWKRSKKQRHHFANKGPYSHSYGFSSYYIWMWELDHKEGWALKNWYFWIAVLEKTLENSLDCRDINQSILNEINPEHSLEG